MQRLSHRIAVLGALLVCAAAQADTPPAPTPAPAQAPPSLADELALAVSKVCVNEAGFWRLRDCSLIWQTVARFRGTEARLNYIRRHSCRVLGQTYCLRPRPCPEGRNCVWSQHLTTAPEPPLNWPSDARFPADQWLRLQRHVRALMRGDAALPCSGQPITWGGAMDAEDALARGLVALECGDTRNTGYARAGAR